MSKYIKYNLLPISMEEWAKQTLSAEELPQCLSAIEDNNNLWKSYQEQGLYTVHPKYEQVYVAELDSTIAVLVGGEIVMSPGVDIKSLNQDSNYIIWDNRFKAETGLYVETGLEQLE